MWEDLQEAYRLDETIISFTGGLGAGATIALSYALLGGFAVAISKTGIPQLLVNGDVTNCEKEMESLIEQHLEKY